MIKNKNILKKLGDILTIANPVLGLVLLCVLKEYKAIILYSIIYVVGNLVCQVVKGICDSSRPREGGKYEVICIRGYSHKDGESCCSGHAMSAALPAYYFLVWTNFWFFTPLFLLSFLCAWTRVKIKAHWPFDVLLSNFLALTTVVYAKYLVSLF